MMGILIWLWCWVDKVRVRNWRRCWLSVMVSIMCSVVLVLVWCRLVLWCRVCVGILYMVHVRYWCDV